MRRIAFWSGVWTVALAAGCGGGGGGGGGLTAVDGGSAYTGVRAAAVLDAESAQEFGQVTTTGFEFGKGVGETVFSTGVTSGRSAALGRVVFQPAADAATLLRQPETRGLARSESATIYGGCGGTLTTILDVPANEEPPWTLTGAAQFSSFCDGGTTIDGSMQFIATITVPNEGTGNEDFSMSMTAAFSGLALQDQAESLELVLTGTIGAIIEEPAGAVMTVNMNVEDVSNSTMVWFQYTVEATPGEGFGEEVVDIDGSVYHSEHGRVSVTTKPSSDLASGYVFPEGEVTSLVHDTDTDTPISGGLLIRGAEGNAAIISVISVRDGGTLDGYEVILDDAAPLGTFDEADSLTGPHPWE